MGEATAFVGGRVHTGHRYVEALLVEDGHVVVAGSRAEVVRARPTGAETVDLGGRLVVPGLIDAHVHLVESVQVREGVDLRGVGSPAELKRRGERWASAHPDGPIFGGGWDQELFQGREYPTRSDLDGISQDRFVAFERVCGHVSVVNSRVLDELGVTERSPDPPGGRLGRGSDGRPNGVIFDRALERVRSLVGRSYRPTPAVAEALLREATRQGLTTLSCMSATTEEVEYCAGLAGAGPRGPRLRFYLQPSALDRLHELPRAHGDPPVGVTGLKILTDGSLGGRTAWLAEPYEDAPGELGLSLLDDAELDATLERAEALRLPVALHAIGDRAVRRVANALRERPGVGTPRIEHASLTPPDVWGSLPPESVVLVVQPHFTVSDRWLEARLGRERSQWAYAFRSLSGSGFHLAGSSDSPVEPLDPVTGIRAAVFRGGTAPSGRDVAAEALTVEEALALYTTGGARALGEAQLGHLEVGASADMAVLGGDSLNGLLAPDGAPVRETWYRGRRVFGPDDRAPPDPPRAGQP